MNKWIGKVCAAVCLLGAVAVAPACGDDEKQCESGQLLATYNGETACYNTCDAGACSTGSKCVNGLCVPESTGGPNGVPNNDDPNNGTPNGTPGNNTPGNNTPGNNTPGNNTPGNNTPGNNTPGGEPTAETIALCEKYADLMYGSCLASCTLDAEYQAEVNAARTGLLNGDGSAQNPGCAQLLTDNPSLLAEFTTDLADATCADLSPVHCGRWGLMEVCGSCTAPTNLGATCADDDTCNGGSLAGICLKGEADPTGECIAVECPTLTNAESGFVWQTDICGTNGVCQQIVPSDGSGEFGVCIKGCASDSECGEGACQIENIAVFVGEAPQLVRLCGAACGSNAECGDGGRCSSTGSCQFECDGALLNPNEPDLGTWEQLCTSNGGTCQMDAGLGAEFCVL